MYAGGVSMGFYEVDKEGCGVFKGDGEVRGLAVAGNVWG